MPESLRKLRLGEAPRLVDMLSPLRARRFGGPLLSVRVTHFSDDTSALGVCWHHSVGDMHSFMLLMRAWTLAAAGQSFSRPLIVEEREDYFCSHLSRFRGPPSGLRYLGSGELMRLGFYMLANARATRSLTFYFGADELEATHSALHAQSGRRITASDALCSHVLSVAAACDPTPRARYLSLAVNYRKRAGLSEGLLGNAVTLLKIWCAEGASATDIASELRERLDRFAEHHLDYHANLEFIRAHGGAPNLKRCMATAIDPQRGNLLITNWSRFGVYEMCFGSARPVLFTGVVDALLPWLAATFEGSRGEGRIVKLVLPSTVANRLLQPHGLRAMHRYRPSDDHGPFPLEHSLPWVH